MRSLFSDGVLRRLICALILTLFGAQAAISLASAAEPNASMQCCRRMHGMKCSCHTPGQRGTPSFTAQSCDSHCMTAAPTFSPVPAGNALAVSAFAVTSSRHIAVVTRVFRARSLSFDSFQRPPPSPLG